MIILSLFGLEIEMLHENVTFLGINIDFMLKFDDYVADIRKKASKQLAVLKKLGRFFRGKWLFRLLLLHQRLVNAI